MSQELAIQPMSFDREQIDLIKRTIAQGATDDELKLFVMQAQRMGLDPFARQIHMVKRGSYDRDAGGYVEKMSIQVGIDGYRLIAERTGRYAPGREPSFIYKNDKLFSATAYVQKLVAGSWHEVAATAHFTEYAQMKKDGSPTQMWATKPHIMLSKCAEALVLRRAFPTELSGVYTDEEMAQADVVPMEQPVKVITPRTEQQQRNAVNMRGNDNLKSPEPFGEADPVIEVAAKLGGVVRTETPAPAANGKEDPAAKRARLVARLNDVNGKLSSAGQLDVTAKTALGNNDNFAMLESKIEQAEAALKDLQTA